MGGRVSRERIIVGALDEVAQRIVLRRTGRRVNPLKIRMLLREVVKRKGFISFQIKAADDLLITLFFDAHSRFRRVSGDGPQWEPR